MDKVYCDTNIFLDYFYNRKDRLRPLGDFAFAFFSKGWNCRFHLIVSDWLMKELRNHLDQSQVEDILNHFKDKKKLIFVKMQDNDIMESKGYENPDDALHAILAKKASADYLATRNIRDYEDCESLVRVILPEFL
jgi:predicted nucleic acid-binding protein